MSEPASGGLVARATSALHAVEDAVLALLLGAMVVLAPMQILLRNLFDEGITWADPLIRVLVLWVGLLGAVSASRGNRHITIDVLSRVLRPRPQAGVAALTGLFTTLVCAVVAFHSGRFVATEREYESIAFSGIEAWIFQIVIPFSFGAIALRYALYTLGDVAVVLGLRAPDQEVRDLPGVDFDDDHEGGGEAAGRDER